MIPDGAIVSGFISKIINDLVDVTKDKIKKADSDRKAKNQSFETRIYQVMLDAINQFTYAKYRNEDVLYDVAENLLNGFKHGEKNNIAAVKFGLSSFISNIDDTECERFIKVLCHEISKEANFDVYKEILLILLNQKDDCNYDELQQIKKKLDEVILKLDNQTAYNENKNVIENVKFRNNKKQKYIENWNSRLFLHQDNDERPITLSDAFIMPDYRINKSIKRIDFLKDDTLDKIIEKFVKYKKTSTMLITGVPGIGKSTITSWLANKNRDDNKYIILRFRDWESLELENGLLKAICNTLECKKKELENKIVILDGFDEIKLLNLREKLLDDFANDIKDFENLKFIITSRPTYINSRNFDNNFELCPFDCNQIILFYKKITNSELKGYVDYNNIDVFGIPVILYMALMSKIDITKNTSKPQLYNRIFAEKGGIFDRFYDGEVEYDKGSQILRNAKNIKVYLGFLRAIAFKMFGKNSLLLATKDCEIPKLEFGEDSVSILEFPIKHLFENTEASIEFIHKSIYEFFVSEYIFWSIYEVLNMPYDELAGSIGEILEWNILSEEIIEFLRYKFRNSKEMMNEFEHFVYIFETMMKDGMTYYVKKRLKKVIDREVIIFTNVLHILHFWGFNSLRVNSTLMSCYLQGKGIAYDLSNVSLMGADLKGVDLRNSNLRRTNLRKTDLRGADLRAVNLRGANLSGADLRRTDLRGANLEASIWYESDIRKALLQLKTTHFTYLLIRKEDGVKEVRRSELFPDEKKYSNS